MGPVARCNMLIRIQYEFWRRPSPFKDCLVIISDNRERASAHPRERLEKVEVEGVNVLEFVDYDMCVSSNGVGSPMVRLRSSSTRVQYF